MEKKLTFQEKLEGFENLWGNYISKLQRLEELEQAGRYGYQLRMPSGRSALHSTS